MPHISVILPVYNGAKHLAEAIDSILIQTFSDFEFIIIDDGSTDDSLAIVESYALKDPRIVIISRPNRGLVETLNEGIKIASGKIIARMDADDISHINRFELQLAKIEETGADICGSWINSFGGHIRYSTRYFDSDSAIKMDMLFRCPIAHPTVMIKACVAKKLMYHTEFNYAEDYDLWARAAIEGYIFTNVQKVLLDYRVHQFQISQQKLSHQKKLSNLIKLKLWNYYYSLGIIPHPDFTQLDHNDSSAGVHSLVQNIISLLSVTNSEGCCATLINITRSFASSAINLNITLNSLAQIYTASKVHFGTRLKLEIIFYRLIKKYSPTYFVEFVKLVKKRFFNQT